MTAPAGVLYVVATPIGNLGDLSARAIETFKACDLVACEDTRHTGQLLTHCGVRKPMVSYHDHSERQKAPQLVEKLKEGAKIALVSDAGTPGIADPGYRLVKAAAEAGIRIEAVAGPSAVIAALSVSGLATDKFAFEGFAPVKSGQKRARIEAWKNETRTIVFYESPHRIQKTLAAMREVLGDAHVVVCRELTKKFEEVVRGRLSEIEPRWAGKKALGEFVVLFDPRAVRGEAEAAESAGEDEGD